MCKMYPSPGLPSPVPRAPYPPRRHPAAGPRSRGRAGCRGLEVKHGNSLEVFFLFVCFFFPLSFSAWTLITGLNLQPREREGSNVQLTGGRGGGTNRKESGASFRVKSCTGLWTGRCLRRAVLPGGPRQCAELWAGGEQRPSRPALAPRGAAVVLPWCLPFPTAAQTQPHHSPPRTGELGHARACRNISRNKAEIFLNALFLCQPQSGPFSLATGAQPRSCSELGLAFPRSPALLPSSALAPACPCPAAPHRGLCHWQLGLPCWGQARKKQLGAKGMNPTPRLPLCPGQGLAPQPGMCKPPLWQGWALQPCQHCIPLRRRRMCHLLAAPTRAASRASGQAHAARGPLHALAACPGPRDTQGNAVWLAQGPAWS